MEGDNFYLQNSDESEQLYLLDIPQCKPRAYAIFAHCFDCSTDSKTPDHISHSLRENGIACLTINFTAGCESKTNSENTATSSDVNDIINAASYLTEKYCVPQILIGHSLAGTAVLLAAGRIEGVKAIITIGAPFEPSNLINDQSDNGDIKYKFITIGESNIKIKPQFLEDIINSSLSDEIPNLNRALLIMHSPIDNVVSINDASLIFESAKHPKSFISLHNSDHMLSGTEDSIYAGNTISAWVSKYISPIEYQQEKLPANNYVVTKTKKESHKTDIFVGRHHLIADEPLSVGGSDKGPDPYDYLLASLGSCTSMTVMMYANRKGWNVDSVEVSLNHFKIHASDCKECESQTGKVDIIERNICFSGTFDEEQKKRLIDIADKCPVHRTLHSEIVVKTNIIE